MIIAVGNPPQSFEVLPATEIPETWVVSTAACNGSPSNCTELRGGTFNISHSNTWAPKGLYQLAAERNLGLTTDSGQDADNGLYGFDKLGVRFAGTSNVSLDQQVIAAINTSHFYLGNLGLSASRPIIFGDTSTSPGFLESLKTNNLVPSRSYGYTAGASYRKQNSPRVQRHERRS